MLNNAHIGMTGDDTCVICGRYTTEGTQVCIVCQKEAEKGKAYL